MKTATMRFEDEVYSQIKSLAEFHGLTPTTFMKNAILEQLEDELDYQYGIKAIAESNGKTVSHDQMMERLGLV